MRTLTLAALATLTATLISAPAFATEYGYGYASYGHSSYGHSSYGHSSYGSSYGYGHASSYGHYQPTYHAPTYHAPTYETHQPTTSYETKPAYVYQKVPGYCVDKVVSYGYGHDQRHTVECKAGEHQKAEAPVEPPPAPPVEAAPAPVEPPK